MSKSNDEPSIGRSQPLLYAVILSLLGWGACTPGPSDSQCKQLLQHLVDLEFAKGGVASGGDTAKAELAKSKAAVVDAKASEFIDTCKNKMSKARIDCALAASSLDGENGVAKCDEAK